MKFAVAALLIATASAASADPLNCTLRDYTAQPGLSATASAEALILAWEAERGTELRLRLTSIAACRSSTIWRSALAAAPGPASSPARRPTSASSPVCAA